MLIKYQIGYFFFCYFICDVKYLGMLFYKNFIKQRICPMTQEQSFSSEAPFAKLIKAIKQGSLNDTQSILRAYGQTLINQIDPLLRQPPLYFAAVNKSDEISCELFKLLIRHGANYRYKDANEQTVLFYVCRQGKQKCAEILLSQGLSLDDVDVYGQTPMFYAASQDRTQIVRKYATKQRVNHADNLAGQTPLYYAARRGHLELCKLLIQKGADVTHVDSTGKTAVEYARKAKFSEVAQYLNNQLKRSKVEGGMKMSLQSYSLQQSIQRKKKDEPAKFQRQTYKIVFLNDKGEPHDLTQEDVRKLIKERPQLEQFLTSPQEIPQQTLNRSSMQNWQRIANKILTQCSKSKGAYWFTEPVNPVKYNILDYFQVITRPMDLGTVRKKLSHHCYLHPSEFVEDMNLIWNNCYRYNGQTHEISKCAKQLQLNFKEYIGTYGLDKYMNESNDYR